MLFPPVMRKNERRYYDSTRIAFFLPVTRALSFISLRRKGVAAMGKRIIVSGGDEVRVFAPPGRGVLEHIRLEGAGTLCACGEHVFCASNLGRYGLAAGRAKACADRAFCRRAGYAEHADFSGWRAADDSLCGSGQCSFAGCGLRRAMVLARAGVNPQHMSLDESGEVLAVAAGESGEVLLLSARSLALLRRLPMPGIVLDVALRAGHGICALPE